MDSGSLCLPSTADSIIRGQFLTGDAETTDIALYHLVALHYDLLVREDDDAPPLLEEEEDDEQLLRDLAGEEEEEEEESEPM